jgi:hypothetical protein
VGRGFGPRIFLQMHVDSSNAAGRRLGRMAIGALGRASSNLVPPCSQRLQERG